MKTAISVPDRDFERFERLAARHGMNRSEFFRAAAERYADELEGGSQLTAVANAAIARAGQPSDDSLFLREAERINRDDIEW
jgi:metal-responsive CopG/Arc/MetJ family transcriptional regulator